MISITAAVLPLIVLLSFNATGSEMTSAVSDIPARIGFMNIIEDVVIRHADEQKAIFPSHYSVYLGLIERIPPHREPLLAWPYRGQFKRRRSHLQNPANLILYLRLRVRTLKRRSRRMRSRLGILSAPKSVVCWFPKSRYASERYRNMRGAPGSSLMGTRLAFSWRTQS